MTRFRAIGPRVEKSSARERRLALADAESTLVERPADDDPLECGEVELGERGEVPQLPHPARIEQRRTGSGGRGRHPPQIVDRGAGQGAVDVDRGVEERPDAAL